METVVRLLSDWQVTRELHWKEADKLFIIYCSCLRHGCICSHQYSLSIIVLIALLW